MRQSPWLTRFVTDDSGQDLIEYAILTAFIGVAGVAAWSAITGTLGTAYKGYDSGVQSIYEPKPPAA
jgi:Flp pilus assembly pilin Flp